MQYKPYFGIYEFQVNKPEINMISVIVRFPGTDTCATGRKDGLISGPGVAEPALHKSLALIHALRPGYRPRSKYRKACVDKCCVYLFSVHVSADELQSH